MKVIEKWGVDVESAVKEALRDLRLKRDEVDVEVLEESSSGFLGIGSKLAKVRVTPKAGVMNDTPKEKGSFDDIDRILAGLPENRAIKVPDEIREEYDKYEREELEDARRSAKAKAKERKREKKSGGKGSRGRNEAPLSIESTLLFDVADLQDAENHPVEAFLRSIADEMGINLDFKVKTGENVVYVEITGKDTGTIIGKRGQTLDAVQYLAGLVANKDSDTYIRVILDAENYRAKRERTLVNLANRLAGKVERTRRSVTLEPMNPYERKVIHATLQNHPKVTTRSEGKDPYRKVIIERK
ncbi:MAG: protein jag [Mogibacterium sp.]|nr:protein jag [Mogibacterium sp.]